MRHLFRALDFHLSEILRVDLAAGVIGCGAAIWLAINHPERVPQVLTIGQSLVGVILGAVVAGVSIQVAFLDASFLRKLRAINRSPVRYIAPFLFTVVLGVVAMLVLLTLSAMNAEGPAYVTISAIAGLLTVWAVASLIPGLDTLVQFVGLKLDALEVPEVVDITSRSEDRRRSGTS